MTETDRPGFLGYKRAGGRVGTRNHLLVVPTVICASVVAERIAAAAGAAGAALPHLAGCGQLGPDMRVTHDTLAAYCAHPNVGGVIVVALGCEQVVANTLADAARRQQKPVRIVAIQSEGGTVRATETGARMAREMSATLAGQQREWCDVADLVLSLKCGGSDYTSGLAANPALGRVTDRLVAEGGSAVLGEIAEIMGAEHLLAARATRPGTTAALIQVITRVEAEARALGLDIRGTQPSPGNIRGGLTTIEEKSLGATQKGGEHAALEDVVGYAAPIAPQGIDRHGHAGTRRRIRDGHGGGRRAGRGVHDRTRNADRESDRAGHQGHGECPHGAAYGGQHRRRRERRDGRLGNAHLGRRSPVPRDSGRRVGAADGDREARPS